MGNTTTSPAHTPTPWSFGPAISTGARSIRANNGLTHISWASCRDDRDAPQDDATARTNAAFIARACNAHEKLLAAAKKANELILALPSELFLRMQQELGYDHQEILAAIDEAETGVNPADLPF